MVLRWAWLAWERASACWRSALRLKVACCGTVSGWAEVWRAAQMRRWKSCSTVTPASRGVNLMLVWTALLPAKRMISALATRSRPMSWLSSGELMRAASLLS